ncbi:unnamed protein product [Phytophthora fragariaefolia]|uniref:Unnamed protein product n=1 Tax=Phytophthora fragariaefolia TaxID=1490495 RepID=A0A9W7D2K4_9STRA|nr:unnamed protein product [Phytophthora fragariaefolia]
MARDIALDLREEAIAAADSDAMMIIVLKWRGNLKWVTNKLATEAVDATPSEKLTPSHAQQHPQAPRQQLTQPQQSARQSVPRSELQLMKQPMSLPHQGLRHQTNECRNELEPDEQLQRLTTLSPDAVVSRIRRESYRGIDTDDRAGRDDSPSGARADGHALADSDNHSAAVAEAHS